MHGLLVGDEARDVDAAVMDRHSHLEVGLALLAQAQERVLAQHGRAHGVEGIEGVGAPGAEGDHDAVAQELVHRAPEAPHVGDEGVEDGVELLGEVPLRDVALRGLGEAAQVEEEHGGVDGVVEDLGAVAELEEAAAEAHAVVGVVVAQGDQGDLLAQVRDHLEALDPRHEVEEDLRDLRRAPPLRFRAQLVHAQEARPRAPDVAQEVGEHLGVHHDLHDAGLGLELLLGEPRHVAGHARLQAAVPFPQPTLRLLEEDGVDLEEDVRGQAVALVGGEEGVEVELADARLREGEAVLDHGVHEGGVLAGAGQEGRARGVGLLHRAPHRLVQPPIEGR